VILIFVLKKKESEPYVLEYGSGAGGLIVLPVVVTVFVFLTFVTNGFRTFGDLAGFVFATILAFGSGHIFEAFLAFAVSACVVNARNVSVFHGM
jgi:hypothetical protein